jgi:hypothetical protein
MSIYIGNWDRSGSRLFLGMCVYVESCFYFLHNAIIAAGDLGRSVNIYYVYVYMSGVVFYFCNSISAAGEFILK